MVWFGVDLLVLTQNLFERDWYFEIKYYMFILIHSSQRVESDNCRSKNLKKPITSKFISGLFILNANISVPCAYYSLSYFIGYFKYSPENVMFLWAKLFLESLFGSLSYFPLWCQSSLYALSWFPLWYHKFILCIVLPSIMIS